VTSWYDRDLIVATMKSNGFDRVATAESFGCSTDTVTRQMKMAARDEGKPNANQKGRGGRVRARAAGKPNIRWNSDAITKLTCILARDLIPNREIAFEMGVTLQALRTALSRFGLSPRTRPVWNDEAIAKLRSILARDPIPRNREIAVEMGVTIDALQGTMDRLGLTWRSNSTNGRPKPRVVHNFDSHLNIRRGDGLEEIPF
jgi:transposase